MVGRHVGVETGELLKNRLPRPRRWAEAYHCPNHSRLAAVKRAYDSARVVHFPSRCGSGVALPRSGQREATTVPRTNPETGDR
jgi:Berberine and berberine like